MKRTLMAVETHPIQYKAPLFRLLAQEPALDFKVLYAMIPDAEQQGAGFGVSFAWDVPLLEGYSYELLENVARHPAVNRFTGCDTPGVYDVLKRERPDAVLVNGWVVKTCLQTLWACRRLGIPCMVRGEANLLRPRAWWKHALHRLLLKQYQACLAIGSANQAFYRFHGVPDNRIFFAPYAVDQAYFADCAADRAAKRAALRAAFGIPAEAMTFLFAGKLVEKKHPMDLLDAVGKLPADFRDKVCVLVAGDGPLREACAQRIQEESLPVILAGFLNQSQMPDAYAAADVLVLPSDAGETWGLVVNEAMASGRPALVSRAAGCCEDLVVEGETGAAFDLHDTKRFANLMCQYVRAPHLALEQGRKARTHVAGYGLQQAVTGILDAVHVVTQGRG